jgi:protocatechuate 3,4-dioxygenase beta subunit
MSLLIACGLAGVLMQSPAAAPAAAVSGRVVEEGSRAPIAGAQVTLFPMRQDAVALPFGGRPQTATTDQDGRYTFQNIAAGRYGISVQKAGYALQLNPGLADIDLQAGERREAADVSLQRGAVIVGRVLDEVGEPVVNARVMAMRKPPVSPEFAAARGDVLIPAAGGGETNDLGEFRLFGLPPGEYFVHAMPQRLFDGTPGPLGTMMLPTYFPGTADPIAAQPVAVGAGQTSGDIVVRMLNTPAFQVSGIVLDEAGRPVENAAVRLEPSESTARSSFMMASWDQARTDASGKFTINNMTNGVYTLLAIRPVVISGPSKNRGVPGAAGAGGFMSFGSTGGENGSIGGAVLTETSQGGTTIQYRDDTATRVPIRIQDANVGGLEVVVRPPAR